MEQMAAGTLGQMHSTRQLDVIEEEEESSSEVVELPSEGSLRENPTLSAIKR